MKTLGIGIASIALAGILLISGDRPAMEEKPKMRHQYRATPDSSTGNFKAPPATPIRERDSKLWIQYPILPQDESR